MWFFMSEIKVSFSMVSMPQENEFSWQGLCIILRYYLGTYILYLHAVPPTLYRNKAIGQNIIVIRKIRKKNHIMYSKIYGHFRKSRISTSCIHFDNLRMFYPDEDQCLALVFTGSIYFLSQNIYLIYKILVSRRA